MITLGLNSGKFGCNIVYNLAM